MKTVEDMESRIDELETEIEQLKRINSSFIRQVKERSNAEKGQHPKKQHSGYSLVQSQQKEYRFYHEGKTRTVWVFDTIFQTPYTIDFLYDDVLKMVKDDFVLENSEKHNRIKELGFVIYLDCRTYKELTEKENQKELVEELTSIYKQQTHKEQIYPEDRKKISAAYDKAIQNSCFNLNIRMNGRDGYWEMTFNHLQPLAEVPETMRFPNKNKKNRKEKDEKIGEDTDPENKDQ